MTALISNTTLQPSIPTQLPEHLLYSDDWYMTAEAYQVLLYFTDDDALQDLFNQNQLSDRAMEDIDLEIDRLFKLYSEPDVFNSEALNTLRSYISQKLASLNLEEAIIL